MKAKNYEGLFYTSNVPNSVKSRNNSKGSMSYKTSTMTQNNSSNNKKIFKSSRSRLSYGLSPKATIKNK